MANRRRQQEQVSQRAAYVAAGGQVRDPAGRAVGLLDALRAVGEMRAQVEASRRAVDYWTPVLFTALVERGISRAEAARAVGVSRSYVHRRYGV